MLTISLGARLGALCAAALAVAALAMGGGGSTGFGVVRDGEGAVQPAPPAGVPERLTVLHAALDLGPAQETAWNSFAGTMLELDRVSRAFEVRAAETADAAGERARHALTFAVALSEMENVLTPRQSAALREGASSLGGAFICAQIGKGAGS
ncbi:MAG: hypothetical protein K0S00_1803 [Xanthobacteraceae bacterium]|jgi:hypothetical protein|nr:hypothetical protein [Xanthobacteraceae bacterium]